MGMHTLEKDVIEYRVRMPALEQYFEQLLQNVAMSKEPAHCHDELNYWTTGLSRLRRGRHGLGR